METSMGSFCRLERACPRETLARVDPGKCRGARVEGKKCRGAGGVRRTRPRVARDAVARESAAGFASSGGSEGCCRARARRDAPSALSAPVSVHLVRPRRSVRATPEASVVSAVPVVATAPTSVSIVVVAVRTDATAARPSAHPALSAADAQQLLHGTLHESAVLVQHVSHRDGVELGEHGLERLHRLDEIHRRHVRPI